MNDDDDRLWEDARGGDAPSFGVLYDRHRDRVFRHALRLVRTTHDAEDITALVFLEAWRRRSSVRLVDGSIVGWLLVTTNYVAMNAARSARRHRIAVAKIVAPEPAEDHADRILTDLDGSETRTRVRAAFRKLPAIDRNVLTLCVLGELPLAQAAEVLGVPVGTVKSRLSRAKRRLASLTGSLDGVDPTAPLIGELS